jgi:hypothetical protein
VRDQTGFAQQLLWRAPTERRWTRAIRLGAVALAILASSACAVVRLQPEHNEPHATLLISVTHGSEEAEYEDILDIDGHRIALDEVGELFMRVVPGTHRIALSSRKLEYVLQATERTNPYGRCVDQECATFMAETSSQMSLEESPGSICERSATVTLRENEGDSISLSATPEQCHLMVRSRLRR